MGSLNAMFQPQIGCMLSGVAHAAPPQNGALFNDVIEPALPDLGRGDLPTVAVIGQGAQKCKCAGDVIISDDQRHV